MWIESHQDLEEHPKLLELCNRTGWNLDEAIGKLHRLWWWTLRYAEDGNLSRYKSSQFLVRLNGNLPPEELYKILQDTNFVEKNGLIHDWWDYAGRYLTAKYRTSNPKELQRIERMYKSVKSPSKVNLKSDNLTLPNHTLPILPNQEERFEELISKYPNKDGKKEAQRHFNASVKTEKDWLDINKALENYLQSDKVKKGYIKNASTWFNNWRDWIDFKGIEKKSLFQKNTEALGLDKEKIKPKGELNEG